MAGDGPWLDRSERRTDRIDEGLVSRWFATFDSAPEPADDVPQGLHWCLCVCGTPTGLLGTDGHPRMTDNPDNYLPPIPLPRRMWASSNIAFFQPLRRDQAVVRESKVTSVAEKQGGSGLLLFVELSHEIHGAEGLALRETQTIVYREAPPQGMPPTPPPPGETAFDSSPWALHRVLTPSETLLFRYSALTFNSHRIHYDLAYAMAEENYRGLVVHGPLTATLLLLLAQRTFGSNALRHFAFRGLSPAICGEELHLVLRGDGPSIELGAFAGDGRQIMSASGTI